jgi:HEPN domain-containing protein
MNTSLKHLSPGQQRSLQRVVAIIVRAIQPEKILLFGVCGSATSSESITKSGDRVGQLGLHGDSTTKMGHRVGQAGLHGGSFSPALGAYDLLIVSREGDRRSDYELQDLIENRCRQVAPVTALVHDISYVNRRLSEGQYFFYSVIREGTLLYDASRLSGGTPFVSAEPPDWAAVRRIAGRDFERWGQQARAFYDSAGFNYARHEDRAAIFLLHQAAEQIYQAILLAFTGYKPTTHNLDKLRRYTNRFSVELALVFPRDNDREDELFKLLLAGYVDARYKEDFSITHEVLGVLLERVERVLAIAGRICANQFLMLEKKAAEG